MEKRVVAAIPDNLLGADNVDRLNREMSASIGQKRIEASAEPARLAAEIKALEVKQRALGETIVERMMAGYQKIPALDANLDELEKQRLALQERLEQLPSGVTSGSTPPVVINSSILQAAIRALKQARLSYTGDRGSQVWIDVLRRIISKVVVEPSADGESAALAIHGHLAAIMAAQEAWQEASRELQPLHKPRLHPPAVGCR
nr:recombinase family protein [Rhizobium sp. Khangiran2]